MTSLPLHSLQSTRSSVEYPFSNVPLQRNTSADSMDGLINSGQQKSWRSAWCGWKVIALASWCNILLVFVPVVWALGVTMPHFTALLFIFCTLALIPLVKLHDLSVRFLSERIGGSRAGLLNATLSNTIEIVIAIIALRKCELRFVHTTLIGSVMSRLLVVLGLSLLSGGLKFREQRFSTTAATAHTSLLSMSTGAILLPAVYHFVLANDLNDSSSDWQKINILRMSRGVSVILIILYGFYLTFQLWSHEQAYEDFAQNGTLHTVTVRAPKLFQKSTCIQTEEAEDRGLPVAIPSSYHPLKQTISRDLSSDSGGSSDTLVVTESLDSEFVNKPTIRHVPSEDQSRIEPLLHVPSRFSTPPVESQQDSRLVLAGTDSHDRKQIGWALNAVLLMVVTGAVASVVDFLVESLDGLSNRISTAWIGLIVLPTVRVIAECIAVVSLSVKGRVSTSVSVIVGSAIQTALFVVPLMVTLGWAMGKPLGLLFDPFESVILYISVQTIGLVLSDGESNWLDGVILLALYTIIAIAFWFYPSVGASLSTSLGVCRANNH